METDYYNGEKRRAFFFGNRHVSVEIENDMELKVETSKVLFETIHGQRRFTVYKESK
jgi:urease accessory protein UreE